MKVLKIILYVVLAVVFIFILMGIFGPKTYDVSRSKVVMASADQVWPHVSSLQAVQKWSPWDDEDPDMVVEFTGEPGAIGSMQKWDSKKMGKGEQTLTALTPNKSVDTHLKFYGMGTMESDSYITMQDTAGSTKVVWGMKGKNSFIGRIIGSIMNLDKQVGPMFDKGLASLDSIVMASPKAMATNYTIVTGDFAGGKYLGVREETKISAIDAFFGKAMPVVVEGVKKANAEIVGPASGVYYSWEPDKDKTDVAAAFPIKSEVKAPAGTTYFTIPASKSLTIDYMGGYSNMQAAHDALAAYIKSNNLTQTSPVLEEYVKDAMSEQDSTKWLTRIIYFVK
jgi:effector-binding domain-containing protein